MSELSKLPVLERIRRYRRLAADARRAAAAAAGDPRQSFLFIAEQWERLADDAEKRLGSEE